MGTLVERLTDLYPVDHDNPAAFLREMERLANGYSHAEQDFAVDLLAAKAKYFPKPPDIVAALILARDRMRPPPKLPKDRVKPGWSKAETDHADQLIKCDIGRQAVREGWIRALHEWIARNHKFPSQGELQSIKARSMAIHAEIREILDSGTSTPVIRGLVEGHKRLVDKLAKIAFEGVEE